MKYVDLTEGEFYMVGRKPKGSVDRFATPMFLLSTQVLTMTSRKHDGHGHAAPLHITLQPGLGSQGRRDLTSFYLDSEVTGVPMLTFDSRRAPEMLAHLREPGSPRPASFAAMDKLAAQITALIADVCTGAEPVVIAEDALKASAEYSSPHHAGTLVTVTSKLMIVPARGIATTLAEHVRIRREEERLNAQVNEERSVEVARAARVEKELARFGVIAFATTGGVRMGLEQAEHLIALAQGKAAGR